MSFDQKKPNRKVALKKHEKSRVPSGGGEVIDMKTEKTTDQEEIRKEDVRLSQKAEVHK